MGTFAVAKQGVGRRSKRILAYHLILALLLAAGCMAATAPRDTLALREIADAVARLRELINGEPTPEARAEVIALCSRIKLVRPSTAIYRGLIEGLREGEDEFNAVLIDLLDELNASHMAPTALHARIQTIRAIEEIANARIRRAEQADVYVSHMQDIFRNNLDGLVIAWQTLLESQPIRMRGVDGRLIDVTARVQGFALLGLIRTHGVNLDLLLERTRKGHVTAPPTLLSQALIHASGAKLRDHLAQWHDGPAAAQTAALKAISCLQLREAGSSDAAKAWISKLPDDATWPGVIMGELRSAASESDSPRLARARRILGLSDHADPVKWLAQQAGPARAHVLERLAGIDLLIP